MRVRGCSCDRPAHDGSCFACYQTAGESLWSLANWHRSLGRDQRGELGRVNGRSVITRMLGEHCVADHARAQDSLSQSRAAVAFFAGDMKTMLCPGWHEPWVQILHPVFPSQPRKSKSPHSLTAGVSPLPSVKGWLCVALNPGWVSEAEGGQLPPLQFTDLPSFC